MKLTIYIAVNQDYYEFSKILLGSLSENFPNEKIKKIIINDLGLLEEQKDWIINTIDKVEFMKTTAIAISSGPEVHTEKWRLAVSQKTVGLYQICKKENYPILMLDCDMYVVKDFSNEVYDECDIQVCKRPVLTNNAGYRLDYIGCWFLVHTDWGKEFVESWIRTNPHMRGGHKETPALCSLISTTKDRYLTKENLENAVASLNAKEHADYRRTSKILHFKSKPFYGRHTQSLRERILNVSDIPYEIKENIERYLSS